MNPMEEIAKLRAAIRRAGFSVMETSGAWSIHDVSEKGKADDAKSLEVATRNVYLEIENEKLRSALKPFAEYAKFFPLPHVDYETVLMECTDAPNITFGDCCRAAAVFQKGDL